METYMEEKKEVVNPTKTKNSIAIVLAVLVILAIVAGAVYYLSLDKTGNANTNPDFELTNTDELPLN